MLEALCFRIVHLSIRPSICPQYAVQLASSDLRSHSLKTSIRVMPELPSFHVYMSLLVHPTNCDRFYTPCSTKLKGGIVVSPCPSVCLPIRLSVCPSVDRIVSALYLSQYLPDPFHIYTSYQTTAEGMSCVKVLSKFKV